MSTRLNSFALAAGLAGAGGACLAVGAAPDSTSEGRRSRMDKALADARAHMESGENTVKRDAHKAGQTIQEVAHKTGKAISHGAHKASEAMH